MRNWHALIQIICKETKKCYINKEYLTKEGEINMSLKKAQFFIVVIVCMLLCACESANNKGKTSDQKNSDQNNAFPKELSINNDGYVVFGHYEQDGNEQNGPEPIEWEILCQDDNGYLLVSRYVLDVIRYNEYVGDESVLSITWETCTLRKWLNEDFLNSAFSKSEQELIRNVILKNADNQYTSKWLPETDSGKGGNDTEDRIFCLSLDDILDHYELIFANEFDIRDHRLYFVAQSDRLIVPPTTYAIQKNVFYGFISDIDFIENYQSYLQKWSPMGMMAFYGLKSEDTGIQGAAWWLRSPGRHMAQACYVKINGVTGSLSGEDYPGMLAYIDGSDLYYGNYYAVGVRPALYVGK